MTADSKVEIAEDSSEQLSRYRRSAATFSRTVASVRSAMNNKVVYPRKQITKEYPEKSNESGSVYCVRGGRSKVREDAPGKWATP